MIENHELQRQSVRELRDGLIAPAEHRAGIGVDALEIVEKAGRLDVSGDAEARSVGNGAVGLQEQPAVVVPDGFLARRLGRGNGRRSDDQRGQ